MPVYFKKVSTTAPRFVGRAVTIGSVGLLGRPELTRIPVEDTVVLCNGCNSNIYPGDIFLVYLGKRELKLDQPYDCYCESCLKKYFPKAQEV